MTIHSISLEAEQLRELRGRVIGIAGELDRLFQNQRDRINTTIDSEAPIPTAIEPAAVRRIIQMRRARTKYLQLDMFADPAWDILLDLFYAELVGLGVSVSSLSLAAGVPQTTALRWINSLVERQVLLRRSDPHDGRRTFIELSPKVSKSLRRYFAEIIQAS